MTGGASDEATKQAGSVRGMDAGRLREAAAVMRREQTPFFDALADLIDLVDAHWSNWPIHDQAAFVASRYLESGASWPAVLSTEET